MRTNRRGAVAIAVALTGASSAVAAHDPLIGGASRNVVPVMANTPGQFGSLFRTKVAILNATTQSYSIQATLFSTSGQVSTASIQMSAKQIRNYENFLADVFSFTGAGTVVFDSAGGGREFIVTAEVFNDLGQGRYKTVVVAGPLLENSLPEFESFSLGINVDSNTRTNIGFFNDSNDANNIKVDVFDSGGMLLTTVDVSLGAKSWGQQALTQSVSNGYIRWRVSGSAYCYAVVVDNKSSDGTFLPGADYLP